LVDLDYYGNNFPHSQAVTISFKKHCYLTEHRLLILPYNAFMMGVKERKERERVDMKELILKSAHQLFIEKGFDEVSIRNIAEMIEYSPATIYLYFKDKNEIIHALHRNGFKQLVESFSQLASISHPFERLKAMGRQYIEFAMQNPGTYKLLFVMEEPLRHVESCKNEEWDEGDRAFDILTATVAQCQQENYFHGFETESLSFVIWSAMHGLCTLRTSGHLGHVTAVRNSEMDLDHLMGHTFESFVQVLEKLRS
jgi:AcrR family transcriptional regulator